MRLEYVHNLRGLAILLIIFAHSIAVIPSTESIKILRLLIMNSSILFIVIAGFLFAAIGERYTYKNYLINKIKNVLIPYIFLSLPAALIYILGYKNTHLWLDMNYFYQLPTLLQYGYLMITGAHLGPLWFIPMIVIFYLFFPVFIYTLNIGHKKLISIFIISLLLGVYVGRAEYNDNVFQSFLYFFPAYIWGILLYKKPMIINFFKEYSLAWMLFYILFSLTYFSFFSYDSSHDLPLKIIFSTILYSLFLKYFDRKISIGNTLAQISFFLFFIHGYFAGALRMIISDNPIAINGYIALVIIFSLILAASILSFYMLRPFVGKYKRQLLASS